MNKYYKIFNFLENFFLAIAFIFIVFALFQGDLDSDLFDFIATIVIISVIAYWTFYLIKKLFK